MKRQSIYTGISIIILTMLCATGAILLIRGEYTRPIENSEMTKALPEFLVEAEVLSVGEPNNDIVEGILEIKHVYKGTKDMIGTKFILQKPVSPISGLIYYGPIEKGLIGIMPLYKYEDRLLISMKTKVLNYPMWKGISDRYDQARRCADAVETIVNTKPDKRLKLVKGYAHSQIPEISVCAIDILGGLKDEKINNYLQGLLKEGRITIPAQTVDDEYLSTTSEEPVWNVSEQRKALLRKWVSGKMDEYNAEEVRQRIDHIAQHPRNLPYEEVLGLVKTAIANEGIPVNTRKVYMACIHWIYQRSKLGDECFNYLVQLIKDNPYKEMRTYAAHSIKNYVDINDNRKKVLEKTIANLKDEELVKILNDAINKKNNS